jgi:apolipoprotein N-acyltransferase
VRSLLLSFLVGLVGACGFQPFGAWPLTLLAFAVLLHLIEQAPSLRSALARGYWFGVGNFTLGLNWIATAFTFQSAMPVWLGWVAVVLLSFYLAVYPAMAAGLAWRWGRRNPVRLVLVMAAAWIVTEWLRATMFTGFAWNPIGVVALSPPGSEVVGLAGLSRLIGTYGLSGVVIVFAGFWALALRRLSPWFDGGLRKPHGDIGFRYLPKKLAGALLLIALPILFFVFGVPIGNSPAGNSALAVRIVQPNIGQQEKWTAGFGERNLAKLQRLSGPPDARPQLLLWPEAAVTDPLQNELTSVRYQRGLAALRQVIADQLGPGDVLLTGGVTWRSTDGLDLTSATNSVFAMDRSGRILGRYDKAHLVPYGEYLPARPILSRLGLSRLAPGDVDFDPGPGAQTLTLPLAGKVGFQLCYEVIFSGEVVDRRNRPAFIYNPSNDAWFGRWGPPQHLAQARLRALEEGLPVLRSTPTGISAVIDADGRLLHSLPWRTAGVIDAVLPGAKRPTLFARLGNLMPFLFALFLAGIAIAVRRKEG